MRMIKLEVTCRFLDTCSWRHHGFQYLQVRGLSPSSSPEAMVRKSSSRLLKLYRGQGKQVCLNTVPAISMASEKLWRSVHWIQPQRNMFTWKNDVEAQGIPQLMITWISQMAQYHSSIFMGCISFTHLHFKMPYSICWAGRSQKTYKRYFRQDKSKFFKITFRYESNTGMILITKRLLFIAHM